MKSRFFSVFLLFAVIFPLSAQENNTAASQRLTLEECIQYAESNNFTLQSANIDIASSELTLRKSKANIAPTVSATLSQNLNASNYERSVSWGGNYGISAGMTLFNGLSNANTIKKNKIGLEQSQLALESSKNNIRISIIQAFLAIMMNEDMLVYQQEVLATSKEQMNQGEQQFKVGKILESDYKMLQAQYTSDLYNVENIKNNIQSNYLTLKNLLSMNPSIPIAIVRPDSATLFRSLDLPDMQTIIDRSTAYLPELKMVEKEKEIAEYDVKIQKSAFYPSLSLSAGINTGYANSNLTMPNESWGQQLWHRLGENVGLNLNIPIYQRSAVSSNVKQAQYRANQVELEQRETEFRINQELRQSYLDVLAAQNDYRAAEAKKDAYFANYKAYNFKFQYGSVTAVDLIQQQTNYLNQLNMYMQSKYSYVLKRKILDVYMGEPISFK